MDTLRRIACNPSDSSITADFQRLCGIKIQYRLKSENKNHIHTNGISKSNGIDSCDHNLSNGHADHQTVTPNGVKHRIGSNSNGFHKEFQNGVHSKHNDSNGISGHKIVNNTQAFTQANHKPYSNGITENGHAQVEGDSEWTVTYVVQNLFLYHVFSFGASLGNEVFYILFFSATLWNFDCFVVRKVLIVWCVIMYLGQALKDVIKWPRPNSPPVVRLEERYELEYGMPSTHAMVGVAIPFGMLIFMTGRYEFQFIYGLLFAIAWSILVSCSRLYLGMHSVLDIMAGVALAFLLMGATLPFVDQVDKFLISHPYCLPVMVASCIVLCLLYPSLDKWSTARGDTTLTLGVFSGIYAGLWLTGQLLSHDLEYYNVVPEQDNPPFLMWSVDSTFMVAALSRQVIGVGIVVVFMTLLKMGILHLLATILGLDPKDPTTKQHLAVELPYKYVSYFLSAVLATYLMPRLFLHLNIARLGFYSEILNHS